MLIFFPPKWSHFEHLFWSHGAKVGCSFDALLRADLNVTFSLWTDAALMTRWHIGLLQYSQLYYLWKSFGILLHMSEVHEGGVFLKRWIIDAARERSRKRESRLRFFSFLFASLLLTFVHPDPVGRGATDSFGFILNQAQHSLMSIEPLLTGTSRDCGSRSCLGLQLLCRHHTALPLCRIILNLPPPKKWKRKLL